MRPVTSAERRARLGIRHRLAPATFARSPLEVAHSVVAVHGTDPASVYLAMRARMGDGEVADIDRTLYDERSLLRMLGMRRTMFVLPTDLAPVVQAACTDAIAVRERKLYRDLFRAAGFTDDVDRWLTEVEESTLRALARRGEATAVELSADEPRLKQQILLAAGKPYEALQSVSTRVLFLMAAEGRIVRGRPRGTWISSQVRWSTVEHWLGRSLPSLPVDEARSGLVREWLRAFGPGTEADLRWWTGWTLGEARRALSRLETVDVDLDGTRGLLLKEDVEAPPKTHEPWVALLPALDPTPMGWQSRAWFLGEYAPILFDRSGNVGPTVWLDGRVVGGWAQRKNGEIAVRLLEDVGREALAQVEAAAVALRAWIGPVRVTPRFRTPLERELSG